MEIIFLGEELKANEKLEAFDYEYGAKYGFKVSLTYNTEHYEHLEPGQTTIFYNVEEFHNCYKNDSFMGTKFAVEAPYHCHGMGTYHAFYSKIVVELDTKHHIISKTEIIEHA